MASHTHAPVHTRRYPSLNISRNMHPNRWYAFPYLGFIVKIILIAPVTIWILVVALYAFFISIYNSIRVLATGTYSLYAYTLITGVLTLSCKAYFFFTGMSDTYPFFSLAPDERIVFPFPSRPQRWFALPILAGIIRIILMIPLMMYVSILDSSVSIGMIASAVAVLFKGYYPESTHELTLDTLRLHMAMICYVTGISDTYPSYAISFNHRWIKIILIVLGVLVTFSNNSSHQRTPYTQRPSSPMSHPVHSSTKAH